MSSVSAKIETLAEMHRVNPLYVLEWYLERLAIMQSDNVPNAEQLALLDVETELKERIR